MDAQYNVSRVGIASTTCAGFRDTGLKVGISQEVPGESRHISLAMAECDPQRLMWC